MKNMIWVDIVYVENDSSFNNVLNFDRCLPVCLDEISISSEENFRKRRLERRKEVLKEKIRD